MCKSLLILSYSLLYTSQTNASSSEKYTFPFKLHNEDGNKELKDLRVTLFPNSTDNGTDPWEKYHIKLDKIRELNAYNPENHTRIAEHYECLKHFNLLKKMHKPRT